MLTITIPDKPGDEQGGRQDLESAGERIGRLYAEIGTQLQRTVSVHLGMGSHSFDKQKHTRTFLLPEAGVNEHGDVTVDGSTVEDLPFQKLSEAVSAIGGTVNESHQTVYLG